MSEIAICIFKFLPDDAVELQRIICYNRCGDGFFKLSGYTWLRSGDIGCAGYTRYMTAGETMTYTYSCHTQAVRPATHKAVVSTVILREHREALHTLLSF